MTIKEHLDNTLKLWNAITIELEGINHFLKHEKINDQFYRRLLIRNLFSILETYLHVTKELIKIKIIIDDKNDQVSWTELAILHEKKVVLDGEGKVQVKDNFQKFEPLLRFTLNIFANIFNTEKPDYEDSHYEKLKILAKRRNDVTHPKSINDLVITNQEFKDVVSMFSWFMQMHNSINQKFINWLNPIYKNLE